MDNNTKNEIDFDDYTVDELQTMIAYGDIKKEDVEDFYNNYSWADDIYNDGWLARSN